MWTMEGNQIVIDFMDHYDVMKIMKIVQFVSIYSSSYLTRSPFRIVHL